VYLYRGEQYDTDLGLYYLRARYLSPLTGRFLTTDLAEGAIDDPVTLNRYLYADADPVNRMDPTGWAANGAVTPEAGGVLHFLIGPLTWLKRLISPKPIDCCTWSDSAQPGAAGSPAGRGGSGSPGGDQPSGGGAPHPITMASVGPPGRVVICTRPVRNGPLTGGRHAYFWDTRNHKACGMNWWDPKTDENPASTRGTICVDIPGSAGLEDQLMGCCMQTAVALPIIKRMPKHIPNIRAVEFFPGVRDCHESLRGCLESKGLVMPEIPLGKGYPIILPSPPKPPFFIPY
jgi:RHS repeat-associated protein